MVALLARSGTVKAAHGPKYSLLWIYSTSYPRHNQFNAPSIALGLRRIQTFPLPFHVFHDVPKLRTFRRDLLKEDRTVGLVPTMGALPAGHLSLIRIPAEENSDVFVSIFVNPTQFGVNEDLASYPRTWEGDIAQLEALDKEMSQEKPENGRGSMGRITALFHPSVKTMYPTLPPSSEDHGDGSFVLITPLGKKLEGASRPTFFRGVATICTKLFNIVQPERVYFGQKDVQQSVLIRRLVQDFHIPTDVRVIATSREHDGLAMSSRNVYLGERRRRQAPILFKALRAAQAVYEGGQTSRDAILGAAKDVVALENLINGKSPGTLLTPFEVDYISLADPDTMDEVEGEVFPNCGAILSGAVRMLPVAKPQSEDERAQKMVRLIANIILPPRRTTGNASI